MIKVFFITGKPEEELEDLNAFVDFAADTFRVPKPIAFQLMANIAESYPSLFKYYVYTFYSDHNKDENADVYTILMPVDKVVKVKSTAAVTQGNCTFATHEAAWDAVNMSDLLLKYFKR